MKDVLITSSALIVALLVLRRLFRNTLSRRVQYALWGLVLIRLLVPVSLPAVDFSVLNAARPMEQTVTERIAERPVYVPVARAPISEHPAAPDLSPERVEIPGAESVWVARNEDTAVQYRKLSVETLLTAVWKAGIVIMGGFFILSNAAFYLRLRKRREPFSPAEYFSPTEPTSRKIYIMPEGVLPSPCLFGESIYLTPAAVASPDALRHVLAHEETHARHLDPLWALLRGVCLAVYWFDPLVWIAAACSKVDCELACDEGALKRLGEQERIPYGETLLSLIPVRKGLGNPLTTATTMTAGKRQLRERIARIAHRPKQLAAAVIAVLVLAGIASACTFTGANKPASEPSEPVDDGAVRALTGAELHWFNEMYFNGAGSADDDGSHAYSIRNQFANPLNLYEKPEDIDLFELFYCDGTAFSDAELKTVLGLDPENLPCPYYKLTTAHMDQMLTQYTGLTLEQTNKVGLDHFIDLPGYDAYYDMHGDTNYPGDLSFLVGTREGKTVSLYQNSFFLTGWYRVTLEEQEDGGYHFLSNQACEKPAIPTPIPAGEPEAVIPLDGLEPYEAPAVTLERRAGNYALEDLLEHWRLSGHGVVTYRAADGTVNAAIEDGETVNVFLSGLGEGASIFFFHDLLGHDGFYVSYFGEISPHYYGTFVDYFYFTDDGELTLLARTTNGGDKPMALDLDGDGSDELISENEIFFRRGGTLYMADLKDLVMNACPALDDWGYSQWDKYFKRLYIYGTGYLDVGRNIFRWLYFDGERLLLYRQETPHHDHVVDGADRYVPEAVISAARDYMERELLVAQGDGVWRQAGYQEESRPQETYDDWRIKSFGYEGIELVGDETLEMWTFFYELHTIDPETVVLAGGRYLTEDNWVSPGSPYSNWLFFRKDGERLTFLRHAMMNDMPPGSERFQKYLAENLS